MQRVAVISMHTSPLAQPGVGDGGGMNVYVRELVSAMAQKSMQCTTYTRAWREGLPKVVEVEPVPPLAMGRVPVTFVVRSTKVVEVLPVPPEAIGRAAPSVKEGM